MLAPMEATNKCVNVYVAPMNIHVRAAGGVLVKGTVFWDIVWEPPHGHHIWDLAEDPVNGFQLRVFVSD